MEGRDPELARKVRDIIAVLLEDIDAVIWEVEDGVAYIEGVVPAERDRYRISRAVQRVEGIRQVITCLCTERILKPALVAVHVPAYSVPGGLFSIPTIMPHCYLS